MYPALTPQNTVPTTDMRSPVIMASGLEIPTEVVEQIIDIVAELTDRLDWEEHEERLRDLHACALVARPWVLRSRLHLFRHVVLRSDLEIKQFLDSLTNALNKSPPFGHYVQNLRIWPTEEVSCGWIFKALSTLPPLVPHLRELAFWKLPDLRPECVAVLSRFRTVESLWLVLLSRQSLREIVQLINRFPRLRQLHVHGCRWKLPCRRYSGKQHSLTTLDVYSSGRVSLLDWSLESKSIGALTALRADSDVAGSAMDRILETCRSTLRELHLDHYGINDGEWFCMPFPSTYTHL